MASSATATASIDQIRVERRGDMLELRWSDAEERLQGTIHPAFPREGEPLTVSLHVGNFQGAEFDGPLTLTFHQVGAPALVTRTLTRQGVNWHTELTPDASGLWELEVRYRHTHLKVLTAQISVADQPLPRGLGWGLITIAAGTALVLGMRGVLRRIRAQESGPAGSATAPPVTSATASSTPEASTATSPPPLASETHPAPDAAPLASAGSPDAPPTPETQSAPAATTPEAPAATTPEAPAATTPAAPPEAPAAPGSDASSAPPADPSSTR